MPRGLGRAFAFVAIVLTCSAHGQELVISDVSVVDVERGALVEHRDVYIDGQRIVEVADARAAHDVRVIDGSGLFLIPGLWNFHAHLTMEEGEGYAERSLDDFVPNGVLTAVDMGGELERLNAWRDEILAGARTGPAILVAGPFIDGEKDLDGPETLNAWRRRSMRVIDSAAQVGTLVSELSPQVDLLKAHSRLPPEAFFALAAEASMRGKPLAAHLPVGVSPLEAVRAGVDTIEHSISFLGDAMYEDDPEVMQAGVSATVERLRSAEGERLFAAAASSGTCVTPTLLATVRIAREQAMPFFMQVADDLEWITLRLHENGVRLLAGSDAAGERYGRSQAEDLLLELEHLASIGIPASDVLRSATINPALCLRREGEGSVAPGAAADLVLLEGNPLVDIGNVRRIRGVIVKGRPVDASRTGQ